MQSDNYTIALLIAKYMANNINPDELLELKAWREESVENEALFQNLIKPDRFAQWNAMAQRYDRRKSWQVIKNNIHPKQTIRLKSWYYYAAAVILLPFLLLFFFKEHKINPANFPQENLQVAVITPGSQKATLILNDGSQVDLDDEQSFFLEEKEGTRIKKDSTGLNYESNKDSQEIIYNQIKVPRGGEYAVVLSDGSRVYLNALSSLRYPVNFQADSRIVELTGEAYFEVKKSDKPFIVSTQDSKIEVLGTAFNVSTYPEDEMVRTTLVEGRVKIQLKENMQEIVLNPSEQMAFNRVGKELSVNKVDVNSYIAWKDGLFYFKDWQLKDIMTYLSRWYDFKVRYKNKNSQSLRFGGKFDRNGDLTLVLNLLEQTGKVKFEINDKTIIIH
jgi:ferric-dicitrate binding protein FerR (iron transport regulator)